jgi:hypothetical protein
MKSNSLRVSPPVVRIGFKDNPFGGLIGTKSKGACGKKTAGFLLGDTYIPCFEE